MNQVRTGRRMKFKDNSHYIVKFIFLLYLCGCAGKHVLVDDSIIPEKLELNVKSDFRIKARPEPDIKPHALISMSAVGDLMLGSWIIDLLKEKGVDYPFDHTREFLQRTDLAIANLEAPITESVNRFRDKKYTFKIPPSFVKGIKNSGIDVVTLANNHMLDFGCEGLEQTIAVLDSFEIYHCGAGKYEADACAPVFVELFGIKIAFLGYSLTYPDEFWATASSCGTCFATEQRLEQGIKIAEQEAQLTIVSFHWGAEKRTTPKPYQIQL